MPTSKTWAESTIAVLERLLKEPLIYHDPKVLYPEAPYVVTSVLESLLDRGFVHKAKLRGCPEVYGLTDKGIEYLTNYEKGTHNDVR